MDEAECTALVNDGDALPNPLFTPPCDCPRCAPSQVYDRSEARRWLRISGQSQRYRVEPFALGETGRSVLG